VLFTQFDNVNFPKAILFQKKDASLRTKQAPTVPQPIPEFNFEVPAFRDDQHLQPAASTETSLQGKPAPEETTVAERPDDVVTSAASLYQEGRYAEVIDT